MNEMNLCKELRKKNEFCFCSLLGDQRKYIFEWKDPVSEEQIDSFVKKTGHILPKEYIDFLKISNGATIYKSKYEDDGYKLFGLDQLLKKTEELNEWGYDIESSWLCFCQCLFSNDVLLIDLKKERNYILDGDVGYPSNEWEYLNGDFNTFMARLYQCNGAMYWRW